MRRFSYSIPDDTAEIAEIARHVLAGECPYHVEIPCEYFEDCSECWWWHLTREEVK